MKGDSITRIPKELDDVLNRWKKQSRERGFKLPKAHIMRVLAHNLKDYEFRPDRNIFQKKNSAFDIFGGGK